MNYAENMPRLIELTDKWNDGTITNEEKKEYKRLTESPYNRAEGDEPYDPKAEWGVGVQGPQ